MEGRGSRGLPLLLAVLGALTMAACTSNDADVAGSPSATLPATSPPSTASATTLPDETPPVPTSAPQPAAGDPVRLAEIDRLETAIFAHPDAGWRVGDERLIGELEELRTRADELTSEQLALEIVRIVALIDGHTVARPTDGWDVAEIGIYRFADGFFVTSADDEALVGSRVVEVGGVPINDAWDAIVPYVSWDNAKTVELVAPTFFRYPEVLAELEVTDDPTSVTYTLESADGSLVEHTPSVSQISEPAEIFELVSSGLPTVDGVRNLEHRAAPFWSEYRSDNDVVYLQFNRVSDRSTSPFTGESRSTADETDAIGLFLDEHPSARLVVDIRHNPGGNNQTLGPFLSLVEDRAALGPCAVAILIGRQTFSAAANFATMIEQRTDARFYGEPTGGRPNLYGDVRETSLDELGLNVFVSSRYWQMSTPDDTRDAVPPDVEVALTSDEYFSGRDPVMDAVVSDPGCAT